MEIGKPQREIIVEPIATPMPSRDVPAPTPVPKPVETPEQVPA